MAKVSAQDLLKYGSGSAVAPKPSSDQDEYDGLNRVLQDTAKTGTYYGNAADSPYAKDKLDIMRRRRDQLKTLLGK